MIPTSFGSFALVAAYSSGAVYLASGVGKANPSALQWLRDYLSDVWPGSLPSLTAPATVVFELAIGAALFAAPDRLSVRLGALCFSVALVLTQFTATRRGVARPCSCFGALDRRGLPISPVVEKGRLCFLLGLTLIAVAGLRDIAEPDIRLTAAGVSAAALALGGSTILNRTMTAPVEALSTVRRARHG